VNTTTRDRAIRQAESGKRLGLFFSAALVFLFFLAISYQLWLHDLLLWGPHHFIPDGHGEFAEKWHQFLSNPGAGTWADLTKWSSGYYQAGNWLTAFLAGLVMFITGSTLHAFFLVSGISSAVTSWFLYVYLRRFLRIKGSHCLMILILFWSHIVVLTSLLRPMTDALLLAFVTASLYLITDYFTNRRPVSYGIIIIIVLSLGIMVKFSFAPILAVPLTAWIFLKFSAKKPQQPSKQILLWSAACLLIPLFFWFIYVRSLDLFPTIDMQRQVLKQFRYSYNPLRFIYSFIIAGQGYLFFLKNSLRNKLTSPAYMIPLLWSLGYLVLIISGGVPFWNRHFLVFLPVLFIICGESISRYIQSRRYWWILPSVFILINFIIVFLLLSDNKGSPLLQPFLYG